MDIKQTDRKDKIITFFDEVKSSTVQSAIKDLMRINCDDMDYTQKCL